MSSLDLLHKLKLAAENAGHLTFGMVRRINNYIRQHFVMNLVWKIASYCAKTSHIKRPII